MDASVVVCGRVFPHNVLRRIKAAVRDHPGWSRADLARSVCDWLDWRAEGGKRKAVNCRLALVRLQRRVAAAHDADRLTVIERAVATGAVADAAPD